MFTLPEVRAAEWRKSTRSGSNGCVEVLLDARAVGIRDSKDAASPEIYVDPAAWRAFISHITER